MTQMLWEKAIRWYMLGHAGFLAMTAFAVSYKTLAQIPKYPPGSFFQFVISEQTHHLVEFYKKSEHDCCFYK